MQIPATSTDESLSPAARRLGRSASVAALCVLTVVLLTLSFAPYGGWFLAYVALVPWTLAVAAGGGCGGERS